MRVVFSTYECPGLSGNIRRATQMAAGLAENGCEVILITSASKFQIVPRKYQDGAITIIESSGVFPFKYRFAGFDPFDLVVRLVLCLALRVDVFHSFNPKPVSSIPCLIAAKIRNKPWFFDWADLWGPGGIYELKKQYTSIFTRLSMVIETKLEVFATAYADCCTCISKKMVTVCKNRAGNPLYLSVGSAPDLSPVPKKSARKQLGIPQSSRVVGFIYSDSPDALLVQALIRSLEKKRVQFLVLGPRLFKANPPKNLLYNAFTDRNQVATYLSACDICLVPFSKAPINEYRYPNKIGDYLACGKPFITSAVGDMTELMTQENIGWLAASTPKALATKVSIILSNTTEIAQKTTAIRTYAKHQTWKKLTLNLKKLYLSSATSIQPSTF